MVNYQFSFFFNLVKKNSFTVKKISKCRENGIDRLPNGNLLRRRTSENGFFALKTHQMFSIHTTPEEFEEATYTGHFVFEENSGSEIT